MAAAAQPRYLVPTRADRATVKVIAALVHAGLGPFGARELQVRGRTSGAVRTTVVNVLTLDGARYLVAPRGTTQWVRNLRHAGVAELRLGRHHEPVRAVELADGEKAPVLRAYLARWGFEVGRFFPGLGKNPTDAALGAIAADFPVFRLLAASAPDAA